MFVILSGVAGSGKDTIKVELMKKIGNLTTIKSYTTREKRNNKDDLNRYYFVSEEDFIKLIKEEKLYEYSVHHNHYYGTSKEELDKPIREGKIVIKDIDVNGTKELLEIFKDKHKVISIFLKVDRDELLKRLIERGTPEDEAYLRLDRQEYEESLLPIYDYVIKNDNLEKTLEIIEKIIEEEYKLS